MRKILYTAVIGDYEEILPFERFNEDWEYILITDNRDVKSDFWDVYYIDPWLDNTRQARHIKMFPTAYLPEHDVSVWVDGNIYQDCDLNLLVKNYLNDDIAIRRHLRTCVYAEAEACIDLGRGNVEEIRKQMKQYLFEGYPVDYGMVESGIIIRKKSTKIDNFCSHWWKQIEKYSSRDQLSFNYTLWKEPIPVSYMNWDVLLKEFKIRYHGKN